ncbi:MAG: glycosyltransferase family 2 protein [bacterium]|nr:glycosyltransferase family 2 protein [bacterium]
MTAQGKGGQAPFISVVIPAYNEEERLGETLERVCAYLSRQAYGWEVIVVDDGSTDGTASLCRAFAGRDPRVRLASNPGNRGKGYSVRHGVDEARGDCILFSDADLSAPIEDVERLLEPVLRGGFDIAIGSRAVPGADIRIRQPWHRELMGRIFNGIVRLVALRGFSDTQCGFKLFRAAAAKDLFRRQRIERFSFDVEALYLARRLGYRVAEVPVTWSDSPSSRVRVAADPYRMFLDVLRIRLYDLRGWYD